MCVCVCVCEREREIACSLSFESLRQSRGSKRPGLALKLRSIHSLDLLLVIKTAFTKWTASEMQMSRREGEEERKRERERKKRGVVETQELVPSQMV